MSERISNKDFKEKFGSDLTKLKQALNLKPKNSTNEAQTARKIISSTSKGGRYAGIDTGVNTGVAIWNSELQQFEIVACMLIHRAVELILKLKPDLVRVEDARLRKWFGESGTEKHQGAGSVKRDAKIWEDLLKDYQINFEMVAPAENKTKLSDKQFKNLTGWKGRTNEHGRDAGMLVFGW